MLVTDIVLVMEEPYTRTVTNGNYGTICLSRAAATIEGATMYRIVGGNASEGITIEEVASMEAGKPYIFQASANQITVTMTTMPGTNVRLGRFHICSLAAEIISPHSGCGGTTPMPR